MKWTLNYNIKQWLEATLNWYEGLESLKKK